MNDVNEALPAGPAAHDASHAGRVAEPAPARRFTLRDLSVRVFYRARILRNCMLLGLLLGGVAAWMATTYYTADALLLVFIGPESVAAQDAAGGTGPVVSVDGIKVVQSEIQIIQTDQVIQAVVDKIGADTLYPRLARPRLFGLRPPRDPAARKGAAVENLRHDLRVEAEVGSNIIRIGFTHPDRAVAIRTVQAVVDAYLEQRRGIYSNSNSSYLNEEVARYSRRMQDLETEIQTVRTRYDVLDMAQDIVLATNRLDGIVQRQNQVRERRVAVETEIVAVKANLATQPQEVLDFRETSNNTGNDEARNTLVRLEQERTHLTQQYSADWPALRELDQKIATLRSQIGTKSQSLYFTNRTIRNPAVDVLNNRLASLEVETKALSQQLTELDDQSAVAQQRITSLREADGKLHGLQLTRDVAEAVYRQLAVRQPGAAFQANVVEERNANLHVVQPPDAPLLGHTLALSYLAGGVFLGLLLGIVGAAVATLQQQVYIMPSEAERDLGLPSLGEFSLDRLTEGVPDDAQGISALAALLNDITVAGRPLSSVQVVGVSEDDGKAAVIQALGIELAQGYSARTLILDLDGDGRSHARAFGRLSAPAERDVTTAVPAAATDVPDLWVSIGAPQAIFGDHTGPNARLRQTLEALRSQFAMVLVIASPNMSGHLARRLAGLVDANLLVLRAEHSRAAAAAQLCENILSTGGNMLGFMFVGRKFYVPQWLYRRI
jgi:uncharacterized protein involved in exopolysaccharide biosynthesis/Mrp family chromosome partitioning ATPase